MTDAWSDRKRRSIMNLCVNSRMGTVFISSKECSNESHTSQYIYDYVESCIQQVGPDHVVQVVTDNATNNMGAAKLLQEKRPTIFWTSCAKHTINLMLKGISGLPRFKKVLDQAKKLTIFIYAHHKTLAMMRNHTKKREIIRPGVTRFASAFLTLQSLSEKKEQLKNMFSSNEWVEECKFSGTPKGRASYGTVTSLQFWAGVTQCLKVFSPLVKVLRMVDADWKPSMGFVYGELKVAKEEIVKALGGNEKAYKPIIDIINHKMKGRLDSKLHLTTYLLNPYYHYKDSQLQHDPNVMDAVLEFFDTLLCGDFEMQRQVVMIDLPKYKEKVDRFGADLAIKGCLQDGGDFLVHTKKRNRLETNRLNNLVYVQFNANLMEKNKKRKDRTLEVLLANDSHAAQEWMIDGDDGDGDEVDPESLMEAIDEALGTNNNQVPHKSSTPRELFDEDFESDNEEQMFEEDEYESDGVKIVEELED
ncbi:uncharacterized protein LOC111918993 [Lactuca sativa]|uniref:uncharacterized protein LOC111918993 n=1 Tax=Lactuca sativa TaxID=4236 RepID=UPI000CD97706|nr:uncharacterized protein LOC111918993 [Lactuca sativa]